jgi:phosphoglycerate kinase
LVILGGAKVTDKIELILNMLNIADELIIGGGMSGPFLKELYGLKLGSTKIVMPENPRIIRQIIDAAREKGVKIHLPVDGVCAQSLSAHAATAVFSNEEVPEGW